jgi:DNA polymerase-3 subunit beta
MRLSIAQPTLLKLMQSVSGLVERRHTLPILSHILLTATAEGVELLSTDNEMALACRSADVQVEQPGVVTVPARKLLDIAKVLPSQASVHIVVTDQKLVVTCGSSKFTLATLMADEFPVFKHADAVLMFTLPFSQVLAHIGATAFAMGEKDVRLYLNGLLLCLESNQFTTVASDGHRLAVMSSALEGAVLPSDSVVTDAIQVVLLKKMVGELQRLNWVMGQVNVRISKADIKISNDDFCFSARLLDAQYPDYRRVLPEGDFIALQVNKVLFKEALQRASILSHDKHRVVFCHLSAGILRLQASNAEKESAIDELAVDYSGSPIELVYNVDYLMEALQVLSGEWIHISVYLPSMMAILTESEHPKARYLVMPMRL